MKSAPVALCAPDTYQRHSGTVPDTVSAANFMHYNFCRIHQTLKVTPVMAAGLTTKLWEIEDLVALID